MTPTERFSAAMARFDEANRLDPNHTTIDGRQTPNELLYATRMTEWLERLYPDASEVLSLASRSQHICRWMIPRHSYPMDRGGYHRWRTELGRFHATKAGELMREVAYDEATIAQVQSLLRKENLKGNPDTQRLEDVICLVFLESYFSDFAGRHDQAKLITILRRTWAKMSPHGQSTALQLPLAERDRQLVERALTPTPAAAKPGDSQAT